MRKYKLLLTGILALAGVVLLETALRFYVKTPRSDWAYRMRSVHRRFQVSDYEEVLDLYYPKSTVVTQKVVMAPHPQKLDRFGRPIRFEGVPEKLMRYPTNSLGFRDREFELEKGSHFRIVCVGDSCTWGDGVPLQQTYPKVMEQKLNAGDGDRYQVINAGAQGLTSLIALYAINQRIVGLDPDVLVYALCVNDEIPQEVCDSDFLASVLHRSPVVEFLDRFYVYLVLKQWLRTTGIISPGNAPAAVGQGNAPAAPGDQGQAPAAVGRTERREEDLPGQGQVNRVAAAQKLQNIRSLITLCRKRNIELIIMTPPMTSFGVRYDVGPPAEAVKKLAASQRVPIIDLFTLFHEIEQENGLVLETEGDRQKLVRYEQGNGQVLFEASRSHDFQISPDIFRFIYRHNLEQTTVIDQLHPTPRGHEIIADLILEKLDSIAQFSRQP